MLSRNSVSLRGKNILGLEYFSPEEIELVLDTAKEMKISFIVILKSYQH